MESSSAIEAVPREGSIEEKDSSFFQLAVEKKKRKRAAGKIGRPAKAELEAQRLTHIVVERNRRRLMNEHLAQLRSLMPSSFIQRGDQASIIGGAIDFIKEMEQMAVYLQAEKSSRGWPAVEEEEVDVEATAVQGHVNLKVEGRRIPGQIVRAISAMEDLRLTVLHLTITSLDALSVLYSLNLKMEDDCKLRSAEEIATAVHQLFSYADTR